MRILGIDPGLSTVGIGLIEAESPQNCRALDWMTITTSPGDTSTDRLNELGTNLEEILEEMKPELAVVEQVFFAKNERTAISVAQARGVILFLLAKRSIRVMEPTPMQLKATITGDGSADKKQMAVMVQRMLKLDAPPTPADSADALGLALYGALMKKQMEIAK